MPRIRLRVTRDTNETVSFRSMVGYLLGVRNRVVRSGKVKSVTEVAAARRTRITPEREAELYEAVLDLLREVGYDALTMDAVAARTRSS